MMKDLSISKLNDFYGMLLTDKQTELVRQYYDDDLSLGEIAENEGISRQAAYDAVVKGVKTLRELENGLKLVKVFDSLEAIDETMSKETILAEIKKILDLRE